MNEEFPHPHPWAMAVHILEGTYSMGLGRGSNLDVPPALTYREYKVGDYYEMLGADEWHAIRPLGSEAVTIMVSGPPVYPENRARSNKPTRELTSLERSELFKRFRSQYHL